MNEIKSVSIIGAGALGLLYAGMMQKNLGERCFFLADKTRSQRIKNTIFSI